MTQKHRTILVWFYVLATALTFAAVVATVGFEVYIRWFVNQNYSVLDPGALQGLLVLFGVELIGLVWLSRSN